MPVIVLSDVSSENREQRKVRPCFCAEIFSFHTVNLLDESYEKFHSILFCERADWHHAKIMTSSDGRCSDKWVSISVAGRNGWSNPRLRVSHGANGETINTHAVSGALVSEPGYLVYTTHGPLRINVAFHGELITRRTESLFLSSGSRERKNRRTYIRSQTGLTHRRHSSTKSF